MNKTAEQIANLVLVKCAALQKTALSEEDNTQLQEYLQRMVSNQLTPEEEARKGQVEAGGLFGSGLGMGVGGALGATRGGSIPARLAGGLGGGLLGGLGGGLGGAALGAVLPTPSE